MSAELPYVPFNRPFMVGRELEYIAEAVRSGHLAGDGPFTKRCQVWLEEALGARRVLLTHSCTAALEMSAILCDLQPGDEVIMPSFTFVSTANAFLLRGARPVFVEIRADTLNLDEDRVEAAITPRTRAIVPVHYAGVGCEMDSLLGIARRHGLRIVEDAAQGIRATYRGRPLGAIGDMGTLSFHETKNLISGEGGALVIQNEELLERAEIIREKGTDRGRFLRGEVDKYTWVDIGSSFLPSELIAAFLFAQLEEAETIMATRRRIFDTYRSSLEDLEQRGWLRLPVIPEECEHNAHLFYVLLPNEEQRDGLLAHFKENGINGVFHYVPLHQSPMGLRLGYRSGSLPLTEEMSLRVIRLPSFFGLASDQQDRVVEELRRWVWHRNAR
ncbi:MAG TPA: dTDP-4-amino-4,6-dideoxygalactose transaminase [Thermoanaerobaculia bacterium]|nr:dTDP-4-amino-4,6-dideoxygalactose transaminase [Thermoanaerobaculia bacterium]